MSNLNRGTFITRAENTITDRARLVLLSVYLYNEYQGFTQLEVLYEVFRSKYPDEKEMLAAIAKHVSDEKKHYFMFRKYFEQSGHMPLNVGSALGYVDLLVKKTFRLPIEKLSHNEILNNEKSFFRLCRLIMMTEMRGLKQVEWLLETRRIQKESRLRKIFRIIHRDEPSHFLPYKSWLQKHGADFPAWREKVADLWIHITLVAFRIPLLYFKWWHPRLVKFPY